jgi:hypothetical protein
VKNSLLMFVPLIVGLTGVSSVVATQGQPDPVANAEQALVFKSATDAATAYWSARMHVATPDMVVVGPIQGSTTRYIIFFTDSARTHWFGFCTVVEQNGCFSVATPGDMFFYPSGKSGTFAQSLYTPQGVSQYFASKCPGITALSARIIDPGISMQPWLWEIKASDGNAYYVLVADAYGSAKVLDAVALEQLQKDRTVRVDKVVK